MKVSVGLIQMGAEKDSQETLAKAGRLFHEAAARGASILCTPELFATPYFCQKMDPANFRLAEEIPGGPTARTLARVAQELGVVIIGGVFERRAPGVYHNSALIMGEDGKVLGLYRKMHLPEEPGYYEKYYFAPGDLGYRVWPTRYGPLSVLICWDQWFPEAARSSVLQGAVLLFYPTSIGWHPQEKEKEGRHQLAAWQIVQRAHAIANGCYVVAVNRVGWEAGDEGTGLEFWGHSFVADPLGRIVAEAGEQEEILVAELDLSLVEETRKFWPFLRDRRVDSYRSILGLFDPNLGSSSATQSSSSP
ncbi:carbon-nitrogen hydrolase [Candidatus Methylacidithermus pantelleriae]|nr:carbon-nitrogen hydrolase [Candidatus Methylacidithermus pantelleriae]